MGKSQQMLYFDEIANKWNGADAPDKNILQCMMQLCAVPKDSRILDAACGVGVLIPYLLEKLPQELVCVDFSQNMIRLAAEKYRDPCIHYECCDLLEYSGSMFDVVILLDALPYFENKGTLFRQMAHLLKNGGRLMIFHTIGRTKINAASDYGAPFTAPLPTASTIANNLSKLFEVDILIDTPQLYAVSGTKTMQISSNH